MSILRYFGVLLQLFLKRNNQIMNTYGAKPDVETNVVHVQMPPSLLAAPSQMLQTAEAAPSLKHLICYDVVASTLDNGLRAFRRRCLRT